MLCGTIAFLFETLPKLFEGRTDDFQNMMQKIVLESMQ
jgi:hypothetical protein